MPSTSGPPNKRPADANKQGGQPQQGQDGPRTPGIQTFGANVVPQSAQGQPSRGGTRQQSVANESDKGRATPPPARSVGEMSEDEVVQLVKDHEVLREKYQKVKRYFFEQQSQVHQLQDTLAHQRLSQSRTSLDDSEYNARFERLHGLVGQLAFNIRKDWRSIPPFLQPAVNKDALSIGKQEMTAVGKALILSWLMDELFDKHFHPDLDPALSIQLKHIQTNIRRSAPLAQSTEEEEALTSKLVSWRLATLDGLTDHLRDTSAAQNREHLTNALKESLATHLQTYLAEPPPLELKSSVPMIVELAVAIASHLPMESRDVAIDYFPPGHALMGELMKVEQLQVPPLERPIADGLGRGMLAGLIGGVSGSSSSGGGGSGGGGGGPGASKKAEVVQQQQQQQQQQGQNVGQGNSSLSLSGSGSLGAGAEERPPRVRMAAGFAVQIRGKNVLVKAQVVPTG
ncbi:hypothetical protein K490DRAFT_48020 [Saccharata proteae CBS 121410]|uniref:Uncharacterized protein n=1 Tax=Saccharata proteae CBS 121410 TaxID=1314787 RepID=A0A9P4HQN5_9PEZI|nr:hypothetical protein K490DRAFT_48020 [Saccharata proteae CBS 121410]